MSSSPEGAAPARARKLSAWLERPLTHVLAIAALLAALAPEARAARTRHYAIATESRGASAAAESTLERGGNAIDAAIAAALTAGLTAGSSSGMGGGGFALIWSARSRSATVLDFRETAPAAIDTAAFENRPFADAERGRSVGVPGEVAGLYALSQRFGRTRFGELANRAADLAERGFAAEPWFSRSLPAQLSGPLGRSATFASAFLPGGKAPAEGRILRAPKLGATLRRIAREGKRGFYEGFVARDLVKAVKGAGGALTLEDLAHYAPEWREPLQFTWEGQDFLTMPPPSAGGLLLAQTLATFSRAELRALATAPDRLLHALAESMRGSFADRARNFGDPRFATFDVAALLSPARLARRKARFADDRTHTQPRFGLEEAGTHHLTVADDEGNWVSLTTTVNDAFGARLVGEASGVVLNDQLDDFTSNRDGAVFDLPESPNRARPLARPVSSMSPTFLLEKGAPVLAVGGSGGITIPVNVTQVLIAHLVLGASLSEAVARPRFWIPPPASGRTVMLEPELAELEPALAARGELVSTVVGKSAVQIISREQGVFAAAADPRKHGVALARSPTQ